jgi:hypothetical protein
MLAISSSLQAILEPSRLGNKEDFKEQGEIIHYL